MADIEDALDRIIARNDPEYLTSIGIKCKAMKIRAKLKEMREQRELETIQLHEKIEQRFEEILDGRDYKSAFSTEDVIVIDFPDNHREIWLIEP